MRNIWINNMEEAGARGIASCRYEIKYMWSCNKDDKFILPKMQDRAFIDYLCRVKGIEKGSIEIIETEDDTMPESRLPVTEAILSNNMILEYLRELAETGSYQLRPYIQTPLVSHLSQITGIPSGPVNDKLVMEGLTDRLNRKSFFKTICSRLNIPCALPDPQLIAYTKTELKRMIETLDKKYGEQLVIKKDYSLGGHGNRFGRRSELLSWIDTAKWLSHGMPVLIEKQERMDLSIGTVVEIGETKNIYEGADLQVIDNLYWLGLEYPLRDDHIASLAREYSMMIANYVRAMGGRGSLNIDYGVRRTRSKPEIFAFECNFRENGLKVILNLLSSIGKERSSVYYNSNFLIDETDDLSKISNAMSSMTFKGNKLLFEDPKQEYGAVIMSIDTTSRLAGIALIADDPSDLPKMTKLINERYPCQNANGL